MNFQYLMIAMKIKSTIRRILLLTFIFSISINLFSYAGVATCDDIIRIYDNTDQSIKLKLKNRINELVKDYWTDYYEKKYRVDADILKNMDVYYVGDEYMNKNYNYVYKGVVEISEAYMMTALIDYRIYEDTYGKYGHVSDEGYYEEPTLEMQKNDLEMIKDISGVDEMIDWLYGETLGYINELRKHVIMQVTVDEESKIKYIYYDYEDVFVDKVRDENGKFINYYEKVDKLIDKYAIMKENRNLLSDMRILLFKRRYGGYPGIKDDEDVLRFSEYLYKEGYYK